LHRTTRRVRLTEAGQRFLADCKRILGEIEEAEAGAGGLYAMPRGELALTAPVMLGRMHVAPIVLAFLARHPEVSIRMVLLDRIADLMDEGFDVAVRIAHLPDSTLMAQKVGAVRRVVCASPAYLGLHGTPQIPSDLTRFATITFSGSEVAPEWSFASPTGEVGVRPPTQLIVNSADVAIAAAIAGCGLTRVLSYQIAPALAAGRLAIVLAEFEPPPLPIHLVHREGRRASARLRAFVDFAAERLRGDPAVNGGRGSG
jgi:DNA-binding transcriptional LysR family regulator